MIFTFVIMYFNRTNRFSCTVFFFFEDSILSEFMKFIALKCVRFQFYRGALCGAKMRNSFVSMFLSLMEVSAQCSAPGGYSRNALSNCLSKFHRLDGFYEAYPLCVKFFPNGNGRMELEIGTQYFIYAHRILVLDIIPEIV